MFLKCKRKGKAEEFFSNSNMKSNETKAVEIKANLRGLASKIGPCDETLKTYTNGLEAWRFSKSACTLSRKYKNELFSPSGSASSKNGLRSDKIN